MFVEGLKGWVGRVVGYYRGLCASQGLNGYDRRTYHAAIYNSKKQNDIAFCDTADYLIGNFNEKEKYIAAYTFYNALQKNKGLD